MSQPEFSEAVIWELAERAARGDALTRGLALNVLVGELLRLRRELARRASPLRVIPSSENAETEEQQ